MESNDGDTGATQLHYLRTSSGPASKRVKDESDSAPPDLEMPGYSDSTFRRISFAFRLGKQGLCDDVREDITDAVLEVDASEIDSALAILGVIQQALMAVGSHAMLGKVIDRKKIGEA